MSVPKIVASHAPGSRFPLPGTLYDVVAIASSAGGLAALSVVLASLPSSFPAAILVVQHLDPNRQSMMARILDQRTPLIVSQAAAGTTVEAGHVYIAPPDRHLLINPDGTLLLSEAERVHWVRPSADLLFESVASTFHGRAIAVVLTGMGVDGADGVQAIKQEGGIVLAQDEESSAYYSMPRAAFRTHVVDRVLPLSRIGPVLLALTTGNVEAV